MTIQTAPRRRVGNTRTPLYATIKQRTNLDVSAAIDLTGLTVKFMMINKATGVTKIAATDTGITVEDATNGQVKYDFSAGGCDTAGIFHGTFIVIDGAEEDDAPAEMNGYVIKFDSDTQTAEEAYEAVVG